MDQMEIGKFIAELRKENNYTQKQLADKMGISDKTISKWECGKGMPELSLMTLLCELLGTNVNELLSGKRLSEEDYSQKAEENMMQLIKETGKKEKHDMGFFISAFAGYSGIIILLFWLSGWKNGIGNMVANYIDVPDLIGIVTITSLMLGCSGLWKHFWKAFVYVFYKERQMSMIELKKSIIAVKLVRRLLIFSSLFVGSFYFVQFLHLVTGPEAIGPTIAAIVLSVLYGIMLNILLLPLEGKLEEKKIELEE